MAYDEELAERVRKSFRDRSVACEEKRMMGGVCFMVDGKMCLGVVKDSLMVRLDPDDYAGALRRPGCVPMDITGKVMRGFVFVNPDGTDSTPDLESWIALALEFNPRAQASRKREGAGKNKDARRGVSSPIKAAKRKR